MWIQIQKNRNKRTVNSPLICDFVIFIIIVVFIIIIVIIVIINLFVFCYILNIQNNSVLKDSTLLTLWVKRIQKFCIVFQIFLCHIPFLNLQLQPSWVFFRTIISHRTRQAIHLLYIRTYFKTKICLSKEKKPSKEQTDGMLNYEYLVFKDKDFLYVI